MQTLLSQIISAQPGAPVVVLFGGNPYRREQVLRLLQSLGGITAYGTLSEAEGLQKIRSLPALDLVLIGGRYTGEQRVRIRQAVREQYPELPFSEPGWEYPYEDGAVVRDIRQKLGLRVQPFLNGDHPDTDHE
jgi:hypothetical protein